MLRQTRQDFALLLVDDASRDDSLALAEAIAGPRLHVHRNPAPLGIPGNWNRCLELTRTPYLCLAHMDDVYEPDYLERMVAALDAAPDAVLAHCRASTLDAAGSRGVAAPERYKDGLWRRLPADGDPARMFCALLAGNFVSCPSILYRTQELRRLGGFDARLRFAPDWDLLLRAVLGGGRLLGVPQVLLQYRRHAASATAGASDSLQRYREERLVAARAQATGVARGWPCPRVRPSLAMRNNLLFDVVCDLRAGDRAAAARKLAFVRREAPELSRDPTFLTCAALAALGPLGSWALQVGLAALVRLRGGGPRR